jgi:hypothetical protein
LEQAPATPATTKQQVGYGAGEGNLGENQTAIGTDVGGLNTGDNLVAIGYQAGLENTLHNQFIVLHSQASVTPLIQGNFQSGSIGIGLALPQANLHVAGNIWASGSSGHITASANISASYTSTGSFGSLRLTNLPTTKPTTTGSLWLSGSADDGTSKYLLVFTG